VSDQLVVETRGPVKWLRLNRPEKRNAMTRAMAEVFREELSAAVSDASVAVVVVTGTGQAFSSGADVRETFAGPDATIRERRRAPLWPVDELVGCAKPVLCCVNGDAVGGGATLAMACDLRIAAESATLAFDLGRFGLTPEFGSSFLLWRHVGYGVALDLMLTGRRVDAREALSLRLVNRVAPDAEAEAATQAMAEQLAALPHDAAVRIKHVLRAGLEADWESARKHELRALVEFGEREPGAPG
jgi:2-(1,2-epoxy-1,2-dihydrophenyl)acetyl-CoA isomerase